MIDFTALHRRAHALARNAIGPHIALPTEGMRTKRASSQQTALITRIAANTARWRCRLAVARVERDKRQTIRQLGDRPQDLRPLPIVPRRYATEAQAVLTVATPPAGGALLWAMVRALGPRTAVEIGSGHGYGALHIGSALKRNGVGRLITFEGIAIRVQMARAAVARFGLTRYVDVVEGTFEETLPATLPHLDPLDLVFADGSKEPEATRAEFEQLLVAMSRGGHMLYDDIDFSPEIAEVWGYITSHPRVRAVTELYSRWGLIEIASA